MCEMYLFETIFVKRNFIYFNEQSFVRLKLVYPKSITPIEIGTSKVGTFRSSVHLNLLHRSV